MGCRTAGDHGLLLGAKASGEEPEHLLDLFCGVVLVPAEYVGFSTFSVAKFMDVGLADVSITKPLNYY